MPTGIDGFSGQFLQDVTIGETISYPVTFYEDDGTTVVDVTGYKMYVAFRDSLTASDSDTPTLEVTASPTDAANGEFEPEVSDTQTWSLYPYVGTQMYCQISYIKADGRTYILDKGKVEITKSANPRIAQS